MRRGHPGSGKWRNDTPRHFRPRGGGTPHFRPPRGYGPPDPQRFPQPGSRSHLGPSFNPHASQGNNISPERDRNRYRRDDRRNNQQRPQGPSFGHQRQILPMLQQMRHRDSDHNQYNDMPSYFDKRQSHTNKMSDVDRQKRLSQGREHFNQRSSWENPPFFTDNIHNKQFMNFENEHSKIPTTDYTGHRPPASDQYGGNPGLTTDNSAFSRSVDDTVNIVRKRLLSRDSHNSNSEIPSVVNDPPEQSKEPTTKTYSNALNQSEQPIKKKNTKMKNVKLNCEKIKHKIVHQLFKMDKDKIHKLMDNPSSSSKFEYAISSLITESQNSYNRHLRSVAEKSLTGSRTEFIHNDNNTIYEDTFMKQMQCLLDPQDTVLLEDIKPMVLAELSKVLQLDDIEQQRHDFDEQAQRLIEGLPQYNQFPNDIYYEGYEHGESYSAEGQYYDDKSLSTEFSGPCSPYARDIRDFSTNQDKPGELLFERRQTRKNSDRYSSGISSSDSRRNRKERQSVDIKSSDDRFRRSRTPPPNEYNRCDTPPPTNDYKRSQSPIQTNDFRRSQIPIPTDDLRISQIPTATDDYRIIQTHVPLFDSNTIQLSDDDDPFSELDKQYHVALDHNFIKNEDPTPIATEHISDLTKGSPTTKNEVSNTTHTPNKLSSCDTVRRIDIEIPFKVEVPDKSMIKIKSELTTQLQDMANMPLKIGSSLSDDIKVDKSDFNSNPHSEKKDEPSESSQQNSNEHETPSTVNKPVDICTETHDSGSSIKSTLSRKRLIEERPSHRKEKRKKTETETRSESNNKILNKNIIINVSDCAVKSSEKCDAPKSIFNLFFAKDENSKECSKENKKIESNDKSNSEKHSKRKEDNKSSKKSKEKDDVKKKYDSISSSHSMLSPSDGSATSRVGSEQTSSKSDTKLKTIDMFVDQPKKQNLHQSHRNTAPVSTVNKTVVVDVKKPVYIITNKKLSKRHISTQVIRKVMSKETQTPGKPIPRLATRLCQTERKKLTTRGMQTQPVALKSITKSTDPFERMKEIDMEIQALLQEKFQLYNSMESREGYSNTMQSLGMAVLSETSSPIESDEMENDNVSHDEAIEDAIIDDFANIPVEELEQMAFESVEEERNETLNTEKSSLHEKATRQEQNISISPISTTSKNNRSRKTPNISLIEQIIKDDRPLEDIISLDDLEALSVPVAPAPVPVAPAPVPVAPAPVPVAPAPVPVAPAPVPVVPAPVPSKKKTTQSLDDLETHPVPVAPVPFKKKISQPPDDLEALPIPDAPAPVPIAQAPVPAKTKKSQPLDDLDVVIVAPAPVVVAPAPPPSKKKKTQPLDDLEAVSVPVAPVPSKKKKSQLLDDLEALPDPDATASVSSKKKKSQPLEDLEAVPVPDAPAPVSSKKKKSQPLDDIEAVPVPDAPAPVSSKKKKSQLLDNLEALPVPDATAPVSSKKKKSQPLDNLEALTVSSPSKKKTSQLLDDLKALPVPDATAPVSSKKKTSQLLDDLKPLPDADATAPVSSKNKKSQPLDDLEALAVSSPSKKKTSQLLGDLKALPVPDATAPVSSKKKTSQLLDDLKALPDSDATAPVSSKNKKSPPLDDLEALAVSSPSKKKKSQSKPKKTVVKKTKEAQTKSKKTDCAIKPCTVRLSRVDLDSMLQRILKRNKSKHKLIKEETLNLKQGKAPSSNTEEPVYATNVVGQAPVGEEPVGNDIQFDMLDVSEDIVIGDNCEVKSSGKEGHETSNESSVSEEIILDNSQSSVEDTAAAEPETNSSECKVYDFSGDEKLKRDSITVSGHADAVLAIECIEKNFIAACLDGNVYYFNEDGQLLNTLRGSNLPVTCLSIVQEKYGTTIYTGSLDSRIRYYDLETGLEKGPECNVLSPIQTMDRAWDTIFVGTRTGFVLQFECKNNMLIPVSTVKFSEQSILALRAMKEGPRKVLLVAARSEPVTIKDAISGLLLRTLEGPKMTVYTLLFEDGKVYCGTSSHQIHIFDYASGTHVGCHEGGKGAVCLRASGGLILAGCYDGCVYVFRDGDARPLAQLRGPSLMLLSLAVVGSKIIAGYKDRSLYIWKIPHSILQEMIL